MGETSLKGLNFGNTACNWSNVTKSYSSYSNAEAFYFVATASLLYTSNYYNNRSVGHPVRCLVYYVIFVRSGAISANRGFLSSFGRGGRIWPSTSDVYSSAHYAYAYALAFNVSEVSPSYGWYDRWTGYSVRCLVY